MINRQFFSVVAIAALLGACSDDSSDSNGVITTPVPAAPVNVSYDVTVTNLTNAQPLSPVAVILHEDGRLWQLGEAASSALEVMAEGGDNTALRALDFVTADASGSGPVGPGNSETISITIEDTTTAMLSVATMLVNTNDAFTGINAYDLSELNAGESVTIVTPVYDAGTEENTEAAGTIPGPADGSNDSGFSAVRDDVNFVARHAGVVTSDDGLTGSVLDGQHKFDNPAMRLTITRTE